MSNKVTIKLSTSLIVDVLAILFIVYLGEISRIVSYPVYLLDPMRMMVVLAIAFTPRWNGWLLALLLPFVSYYMGAHPHLIKTSIMAGELLLNVWLFWLFFDRIKGALLSLLLSIIISKVAYYLLKYICLELEWLSGDLVTTPLKTQLITTIAFSVFIYIIFLLKGKPKRK